MKYLYIYRKIFLNENIHLLFLFQEGSIGSHLVIRPIPPRLQGSVIPRKNKNATNSDSINDDEMFLDQDGELSSEVAIDTGLPIRRNKTTHHHIIIKRIQEDDDGALSDYGKYFLIISSNDLNEILFTGLTILHTYILTMPSM